MNVSARRSDCTGTRRPKEAKQDQHGETIPQLQGIYASGKTRWVCTLWAWHAPGGEGQAGHGLPPLAVELGQQKRHDLEVHDVGGPPSTAQNQQFPLVGAESNVVDQAVHRDMLALLAGGVTISNILVTPLLQLPIAWPEFLHEHMAPVPPRNIATAAGLAVRFRVRHRPAIDAEVLVTLRCRRRHLLSKPSSFLILPLPPPRRIY